MANLRIDGGGSNIWKSSGNESTKYDNAESTKKFTFNFAEELKRMKNGEKLSTLKVNWKPGYEPVRTGEVVIPLDSELGKQISERRAELDKLRETGASCREIVGELKIVDGKYEVIPVKNGRNELDDYVPIYEISLNNRESKKTIIGYRAMTEEEKAGSVNY